VLTVQHQRLRRIEARLLLLCSRGLTITMSQLLAGSKSESARDDGFYAAMDAFRDSTPVVASLASNFFCYAEIIRVCAGISTESYLM
jgi:hypothetical protein